MTHALDILTRLFDIPVGVSQSENDEAFRIMSSVVPLALHEFASGSEHNGWVVPHDWRVRHALIKRDGAVLFDGTAHPFAVAGYSSSFRGTVSKAELDEHVFFRREFPRAYAFNAMNTYRPWQKHWGFCIPHGVYASWDDGDYEIELDVDFVEGRMLVGEYLHVGRSTDTIVFNAHTCHPLQANDDLSGVSVVLALFEWLRTQETHYSYLAVLAPEHLGTVFYVAQQPADTLARLKLGCFVEMVGTSGPLVLQQSFTGRAGIDRVARHVLRTADPQLHVGPFRSIVGNDETVWEGPGIEIPTISVSRWPYPEYHTSEDNLAIVSAGQLDAALDAFKHIVAVFERDRIIERRFVGLPAFSNPKYDVYIEQWDPVVAKRLDPEAQQLGALQNVLLRYFDGDHSVFDLAERFDVPFDMLRAYIDRLEMKGLVALSEPPSLDRYGSPA